MKEHFCKAYAYSIAGLSVGAIQRRLVKEGVSELDAAKAVVNLNNINRNALPVPQVTCHWEHRSNDEYIWWQNNRFGDQFDIIKHDELVIRCNLATALGHIVVKGMPD